jgi:hypothetical protein
VLYKLSLSAHTASPLDTCLLDQGKAACTRLVPTIDRPRATPSAHTSPALVRTRAEFEAAPDADAHSGAPISACCTACLTRRIVASEIAALVHTRRKRPRIESVSEASTTSTSAVDRSLIPASEDSTHDLFVSAPLPAMKLSDKADDAAVPVPDEAPVAGPSSSNGHAKNGHGPLGNGSSRPSGSGHSRPAVHKVSLLGASLYEDSYVDREEYVRLVIQSLRDIGYMYVTLLPPLLRLNPSISESAATLEAESGYVMESSEVAEFRQCILDASWAQAEAALLGIGVPDDHTLKVGLVCYGRA